FVHCKCLQGYTMLHSIEYYVVAKSGYSHKKDDMEITTTIISMAKNLGLSVLAEGVETIEQHRFLQLHGCGFFQGYLFSPAVCASEFKHLLEREPDDPASTVNRHWKSNSME
ncbi:MAG: EAL domain-containing protein, partial [Candidatus Thiodiazotropha sp.]|nr:EAL domain-containing protein [Candidatus Thiodiazotropha sp.]